MKFNYKRTLLVGLCFLSISAFWTFYDQAIPFMLEYAFGTELRSIFGAEILGGDAATLLTQVIMTFDNILAVFMLPLFGTLSDRVNTPLGKRTPFILFGTVLSVLFFIFMGVAEQTAVFPLFFAFLMLTLVALSTYRSPAVALMPDLTPRVHRSKGNAIINLMGTFGGAFALLMVKLFVKTGEIRGADGKPEIVPVEGTSYLAAILPIAGFMLVSVLIYFFTIKEKKLSRELRASGEIEEDEVDEDGSVKGTKLDGAHRRSLVFLLLAVALWYMAYNGCTTVLSRYCNEVWGIGLGDSSMYVLVALIVATVSFFPIALLSSRFGRKKVILGGVALMGLSFFVAIFLKEANFFVYVIFALIGIGWAAINVNSFPMVIEMCKGADIGKYTGYYYTFSMAAQIFTPIFSGLFIANENIGYASLFPYAAICSLLAFVCMLFVKHGDVKPVKHGSILESFDAGD